MGKPAIEDFLSHLATNRKVAASTQRQALNALLFLFNCFFDQSHAILSVILPKKSAIMYG